MEEGEARVVRALAEDVVEAGGGDAGGALDEIVPYVL